MDFGGCFYRNLDFFLGSLIEKILLKPIINLNEIRDAFRFFAGITVMLERYIFFRLKIYFF